VDLSGGADLLFYSKVGQKSVDLRFPHLGWVADVIKVDETLDPMAIGLLGSAAVMAGAESFVKLV
jgi:hypothetical protein